MFKLQVHYSLVPRRVLLRPGPSTTSLPPIKSEEQDLKALNCFQVIEPPSRTKQKYPALKEAKITKKFAGILANGLDVVRRDEAQKGEGQ